MDGPRRHLPQLMVIPGLEKGFLPQPFEKPRRLCPPDHRRKVPGNEGFPIIETNSKAARMSTPLTVDLPHKLGAQEARRRIERNVGKLTDHIPGGATVESRWTGDRLDLDVGAMGQQIATQIEVQESVVRLTVMLPPALTFFRGMIEPLIRSQGAVLLEDKSSKG